VRRGRGGGGGAPLAEQLLPALTHHLAEQLPLLIGADPEEVVPSLRLGLQSRAGAGSR